MPLHGAGHVTRCTPVTPASTTFTRRSSGTTTATTEGKLRGVKLSVSLPDEDVEFLDAYAKAHAIESRSAAVHKALGLLRASELEAAYTEAFEEWGASGEAELWDVTVGDGL